MLDQSFSAHNFEVIFTLENRKGNVDITTMSQRYQNVVEKIKETKDAINKIRRKRKADRSYEETTFLDVLNVQLQELKIEKVEALAEDMQTVADSVNNRAFKFEIDSHLYEDKEEFTLRNSRESYYAMKQLLHNMKRTFKIEMLGRHQIMTSIKPLLNISMPIYIIRTDVSDFFESIPQDVLLQKVYDNNLLSFKSKSLIKQIFYAYENIKDTSRTSAGVGVPRGIGISSMLSEIYMQDIDQMLKSRTEVIFYVRYVDDIFMVLTSLGTFKSLNDLYDDMMMVFKENGLEIKPIGDKKCKLITYNPIKSFSSPKTFEYLGYQLKLSTKKIGDSCRFKLVTEYSLSGKKKRTLNERINNAFKHFETLSKKDVKAARRDLLDSLDYITGNFRLSNSKSHAKAGLYYSNDLIDNPSIWDAFTRTLQSHPINPYDGLFADSVERQKFIDALNKRIRKVDFKRRWEEKKMFDFTLSRIAEISSWL